MNNPSEQLTAEYNILSDFDQPLRGKALNDAVIEALEGKGEIKDVESKRVIVYSEHNKKIVLLTKAITYLGNPHPLFKKRIQIPKEWNNYAKKVIKQGYQVKYIGVYHYDGLVVFVDFQADDYLKRQCHNSSAHVYINDLYQGITNGIFEKTDMNGNHITTISRNNLRDYLAGARFDNKLLQLFAKFNFGFGFGQWMNAIECISEMYDKHWSQWRQTEWQGWFLEYKIAHFTEKNEVSPYMRYTALSNKGHKEEKFDFDLYFPEDNFMGDLKTSDIKASESPGNDQGTFISCINKYGKFWYVIYEHETKYDKDCDYKATKWRNNFIKKIDNTPDSKFNELSYGGRMKNRVRFQQMYIIELNRINYHEALKEFNQGHQPDGSARKAKFGIKKKDIDNFVIYRYNGDGC